MAHKYGAKPTVVDGIRFASQKEARRYQELKLLERAGEVRDIELQPVYELDVIGGFVKDVRRTIGKYKADFRYRGRVRICGENEITLEWRQIVEDVKGFKTPLYRWKKKHVEAQYGITVVEV